MQTHRGRVECIGRSLCEKNRSCPWAGLQGPSGSKICAPRWLRTRASQTLTSVATMHSFSCPRFVWKPSTKSDRLQAFGWV
eukprot:scaffold139_cov325-Pavlova_lutheri.AAC.31